MKKDTLKFWNLAKTPTGGYSMDLFGVVGGDFFSDSFDENDFLKDFRQIPSGSPIDISINSPGGSVFTAISIVSMLREHKGPVTIRVNGIAASAATIITSTPGAKVIMPRGSLMMIHRASCWADGSTEEIRKKADILAKVEDQLVDIYMKKTGRTEKEIRDAMDATTWFSAEEAKAFGLADEVDESTQITNSIQGDTVVVNGLSMPKRFFGNSASRFFVAAAQIAPAAVNEEESVMDLEKLKAEHPDIVAAIRDEAIAEGRQAERDRIQSLEQISLPGYEALLEKAKFESNFTAEMLAVEIVKAQKAKAFESTQKIEQDAKEDLKGLDIGIGVEATASENAENREKQLAEFIAAGKKAYIG